MCPELLFKEGGAKRCIFTISIPSDVAHTAPPSPWPSPAERESPLSVCVNDNLP